MIKFCSYPIGMSRKGGNMMSGTVAGAATGYGSSFALIVVLFILLIIVGAAFIGDGYGYGAAY